MSKIYKQRFILTLKKWVSDIGLDGAHISDGVSLENFPLGGVNRFDRVCLTALKKFPLNLAGQYLCRFIEHIGPI